MKEWWNKLSKTKKIVCGVVVGFLLLGTGAAIADPQIITSVEEVSETIPCEHKTEDDPTLLKGKTEIKQECTDGIKIKVYKITSKRGEEESKVLTEEKIIKEAVPEIKLIGTKEETIVPSAEQNTSSSTTVKNNQSTTATSTSTTKTNQDVTSSSSATKIVSGYCKDGTPVTGDPSAKGRANACYGHDGWVD